VGKAVKISAGLYEYRGYRIELVDSTGYRAWNIFSGSEVVDATETLSGAVRMVDGWLGTL
jgi:hypothetical protein